jgi:hypothetical protein
MLFNLSQTIGLEADHNASAIPVLSASIRKVSTIEIPIIKGASDESTNPQGNFLPEYHYRAEHLTPWKIAPNVIETVRYKYSDSKWIEAKLRRLPANKRQWAINEYSRRYKKAFDEEPDEIKKENRARFITNNWLLETTKSISEG